MASLVLMMRCMNNRKLNKAPDESTLRKYQAEGLTQWQMVERWESESGNRP